MRVRRFRVVLTAMVVALSCAMAGAGVAVAFQPFMAGARDNLQQAQVELLQAIPDKDGHRVDAIVLVQQALDQVNLGIAAGAQ